MAEHAYEGNRPPPQAVLDAEIEPLWLPFWEAFHELSDGRDIATGMVAVPNRIRYTDISAYARDFGFADTESDRREFYAIIRALDTKYVEYFATEAKNSVASHKGKR